MTVAAGAYTIRLATAADLSRLPEIESEAAERFAGLGAELGFSEDGPMEVNPPDTFAAAQLRGHLWVAVAPAGAVVGFAMVLLIDGNAHLEELDVLPGHGRRGVGRSLVTTVCRWAGEAGYEWITLSTFREIPWNGPFYRSCGFVAIDPADYTPAMRRIVATEKALGLRTDLRDLMRCPAPVRQGGRPPAS